MNESLEQLHDNAMELSDRADQLRREGEDAQARQYFALAMESERQAALAYREISDARPATVAILLRSAASLAWEAGDWREAERLIGLALSDRQLPPTLAQELRDLLERVHFQRHLELRDVTLTSAEIQLSLSGDGVSFGMVQSDDFLDRGEALQDLIYRTAEQQRGLPYRMKGSVPSQLQQELTVYVSVPRAASFAVTYRLGTQEASDRSDSPDTTALAILDEVTAGLAAFEAGGDDGLSARYNASTEKSYAENFRRQARRLAPDGKRITQVGLTTRRGQEIVPLALRRVVQRRVPQRGPVRQTYTGRLTEFREKGTGGRETITMEMESGERITAVTENAAEYARYYKQAVRLTVRKESGLFVVQEVTPS